MPMKLSLVLALPLIMLASSAFAQDVDLILPPGLSDASKPFYTGAQVKMDGKLLPVREGTLPDGQLAAFDPDKQQVTVSANDGTEMERGTALLEVLDALQAGATEPAAGR